MSEATVKPRVDVERMSRETGISETYIKAVLDPPSPILDDARTALEKASTLEEAWGVYRNTPEGSKIRAEALAKIEKLAKTALEEAFTLEEAWEVYRRAPGGSEIRAEALRKALGFSSTPEEILRVYHNILDGSEIRAEALRKMATFYEEPS